MGDKFQVPGFKCQVANSPKGFVGIARGFHPRRGFHRRADADRSGEIFQQRGAWIGKAAAFRGNLSEGHFPRLGAAADVNVGAILAKVFDLFSRMIYKFTLLLCQKLRGDETGHRRDDDGEESKGGGHPIEKKTQDEGNESKRGDETRQSADKQAVKGDIARRPLGFFEPARKVRAADRAWENGKCNRVQSRKSKRYEELSKVGIGKTKDKGGGKCTEDNAAEDGEDGANQCTIEGEGSLFNCQYLFHFVVSPDSVRSSEPSQ